MKSAINIKNIIVGLIFLVILGFFLYYYVGPIGIAKKLEPEHKIPPVESRVLIVAPHCDDETLGPGILLHRLQKSGNRKIKVVVVTNGDGFTLAAKENFYTLHPSSQEYVEFGEQRQHETLKALKKLGIPEKDVIFLGYPDAGVAHLWTEFWDNNKRYVSKTTQTDVSPYKNSFDKHAPYTGESLLHDLTKVIDEFKPTDIYFPHPNDHHPDHWGTNAFIKYIIRQKKLHVSENLYLVHRGNWPKPKMPEPDRNLLPPDKLVGLGTVWEQFPLEKGEAHLKETAILKYSTQIRAMRAFLLAFTRSSELFGKYPDYTLVKTETQAKSKKNNLVIADPEKDLITGDVDTTADIKGIYSYIDNNYWVIELAAVKPVNKEVTYRFHARLFPNKGEVKRFDIIFRKGKATFRKYASNSIISIDGMKNGIANGRLFIKIPLNSIKEYDTVFLNADSAIASFNVDKTAWRMIHFKK